MNTISLIARWRGKLRDFRLAQAGNVAIIFALGTLPIVGLMGAAVDYSRANSAKAALQAATDAATLILSKEAANLTADQLKEKADAYVKANLNRPDVKNLQVTPNFTQSTTQLVVQSEGKIDAQFVSLLGKDSIAIGAASTTKWGNSRLRVALALDNTGSMASSGKMLALKNASHKLLDQLEKAATNPGDVYVSIVPFSKDVNVGAGDPTNASWKAPDWVDLKNNHGSFKSWEYQNGTCSNNWRARDKGDCSGTWTPANHNTWNGCVTDRDEDYDVNNTAPSISLVASLFPAEQYDSCPVALLAQTYDWAKLHAKIDAMIPTGNTNTTIGLEWGWHSLSQQSPLNAPAIVTTGGITTRKIIIFLTDGENTENRTSTSSKTIDKRMKKACQNAKNENVVIYTVLVMQGNETLLQECASSTDTEPKGTKYFKITAPDQLVTTFEQIGTALSALRIAN